MGGTKKAAPTPEPKKVEALFDKGDVDTSLRSGQAPFSTVVGVESASGIDHAITVHSLSDFPEIMRDYIPNMSKFEKYVAQPKELEDLLVAWEMGDRVNIVGPTGSGKSSMVEYACALTQRPFIRINGRGDMESSSLLGMLTVAEGSTEWVDGELTMGVRNGAIVCIDEWTLIPPEIMMSLQWLMEDDGKLLLSDMPAGASSDKKVISFCRKPPNKNIVIKDMNCNMLKNSDYRLLDGGGSDSTSAIPM